MRNQKRYSRKKSFLDKVLVLVILILVVACGMLLLVKRPVKAPQNTNAETQGETAIQDSKEAAYNEHLSNYLFMGVDTREEVDSYETQADAGQADSIFLVSLNRVTSEMKVLAIPRDTMTKVEVFNPSGKSMGMTTDHINIQYAFGDGRHKSCNLMCDVVSRLLGGVPIEGYCSINMDAIPVLTKLAGDVEVVVPDGSLEGVNPEFVEGATVTLNSDNVEQFVRHRDTEVSQSALVRQSHQRVFLSAYLDKAQENYAQDASFVTKLYEGIKPYMVTNMGNDLFVNLMEASMKAAPEELELPGQGAQGDYHDEYHVDEDALHELVVSVFYKEGN